MNVQKRQLGFTLLELMLSMALTALLLGMLSAGIYAVVRDWQQDSNVLDTSLDKTLSVLQIERALLGAFPHSYVDREKFNRFVFFMGEEDELSWVSSVSPFRTSGLTAWRLRSDPDEGLLLSLAPAYSDNPAERLEMVEPMALLENYEASFNFLFQDTLEEKLWLDEWQGEERQSLPIAVYISFTPIDDNGRDEEMELLVPIKTYLHEEIQAINPGRQ